VGRSCLRATSRDCRLLRLREELLLVFLVFLVEELFEEELLVELVE
jgi:hypothetical protein